MPDEIIVELIAERPDIDAGPDLAPESLSPCARSRLAEGGVEALDALLTPTRLRPLSLTKDAKLLNATADLAQIVAVDGSELLYAGPATQHSANEAPDWRRHMEGADSATFLGTDRLLVTVPDIEMLTHSGRQYKQNTTHRVLLLSSSTGAILDEARLDVCDTGAFAAAHPADGSVLLDLGEGQDGSTVYRVRVEDDRLAVDQILENVVVAGFSPDGTRLLLLPHPSYDDRPQIVSWPGLEVLAVADLDAAGIDEGGIDDYGSFLSDDHILLTTPEQGLWLANGDLSTICALSLPDSVTKGSQEFSLTIGLSANTFSTRMWRDDREVTTVWRLT